MKLSTRKKVSENLIIIEFLGLAISAHFENLYGVIFFSLTYLIDNLYLMVILYIEYKYKIKIGD